MEFLYKTVLNVRERLIAIGVIIILFGSIHDFFPSFAPSFLTPVSSKSIANQYFVKLGWFWTLIVLVPFSVFTTLVENYHHDYYINLKKDDEILINSNLNTRKIFQLLFDYVLWSSTTIRIVFNTIVWMYSVSFFEFVESKTWSCQRNTPSQNVQYLSNYESIQQCRSDGHQVVNGIDISGHTFLLMFSSLLLISESRALLRLRRKFTSQKSDTDPPKILYEKLKYWILGSYSCMLLLTLLWDYMLFHTALFYHTLLQKVVAALWATSIWYILYGHVYKWIRLNSSSLSR